MPNGITNKAEPVDCMALQSDFYSYLRASEGAEDHVSSAVLSSFVPVEPSFVGLLQKVIMAGAIGLEALSDSWQAKRLANNAALFDEKCCYGFLNRTYRRAPEHMAERVAGLFPKVGL